MCSSPLISLAMNLVFRALYVNLKISLFFHLLLAQTINKADSTLSIERGTLKCYLAEISESFTGK